MVNVCTLGCGKHSLIKVTKCNVEYFKVHVHAYNSRFCQQERSRRESMVGPLERSQTLFKTTKHDEDAFPRAIEQPKCWQV